jgi:hypothetical protein
VISTTNEAALGHKVDEAMTVYHEYIKTQGQPGDDGAPSMNGGQENMNPSAEEMKDPQA